MRLIRLPGAFSPDDNKVQVIRDEVVGDTLPLNRRFIINKGFISRDESVKINHVQDILRGVWVKKGGGSVRQRTQIGV